MKKKTTIELSEVLLARAKQYARAHKTTLTAMIEQVLHLWLADKKHRGTFKLRDASVAGQGLQPKFRDASWEQLREALYQSTVS